MTTADDRDEQPCRGADAQESGGAKSRRAPQLADCAPMSTDDWKALLPMIKKAAAIDAVASDPSLSGGDISVFTWVVRHSDSVTSIAWPSHETLARLTQRSKRNVIDSVARLTGAGYLELVSRGTPTRSNRYRLTFLNAARMERWKDACAQRWAGSEVQFTTSEMLPGAVAVTDGVVNPASLGVVKSSVGGSEISRMGVVNCTSPEPIHQPEHQAKGDVDGGSISSSAADGSAPAGAGLPCAASELVRGLVHNWFWAVYPIQEEAAAADDYLTEVLAAGVSRDLIESKAAAYAVSRRYTEHQFIKRPLTWLQKKGWVDGPKPNEVQQRPKAKKAEDKPRNGTKAARSAAGKGSGSPPPEKVAAKRAKADETPEQKEARAAKRRAKTAETKAKNAREYAEWQAKKEETLALAKQVHASVILKLAVLGDQPQAHASSIIRAMFKSGHFVAASKQAETAIANNAFEYICEDPQEGNTNFTRLFGENGTALELIVDSHIAAVLEARKQADQEMADREAVAALAEARAKQQAEEKLQREAEEAEATRARLLELRESVLSTFHPEELGDEIGAVGARLLWAAEDAGCKLKTMNAIDHDKVLGMAFRNGPGDREHFNRVFNEMSGVERRRLLRGCEWRLDACGRP